MTKTIKWCDGIMLHVTDPTTGETLREERFDYPAQIWEAFGWDTTEDEASEAARDVMTAIYCTGSCLLYNDDGVEFLLEAIPPTND